MALDPVSVAVGIVATFVFSALIVAGELYVELRQAKKQRDDAADKLLAEVGIACLERPTSVRTN